MTYRTERRIKKLTDAAVIAAVVLFAATLILLAVRAKYYRPSTGGAGTADSVTEDVAPGTAEKGNGLPDDVGCLVLVCGKDVSSGLCDTVILVSLSPEGEINAVQIPRDTYIRADGRGMKLNALFSAVGEKNAVSVLEDALGVRIDYRIVMSTSAFCAAVDAIGGVEIDVPRDMEYRDPYQDLTISLKAGRQTLDGSRAEQFVRFRSDYPDGDLGRLDAQKIFMSAFLSQCREKLDLQSAARIIADVLPLVSTDMTAKDAVYFAGRVLAGGKGAAGMTMMTAPGAALNPGTLKGSWYVLSRRGMATVVRERLNIGGGELKDEDFDKNLVFLPPDDEDCERIYRYALIEPAPVSGQ